MDCPTHKGHQLTEVPNTCSECGSPHGVSHRFCVVDGQQYDVDGNPVLVEAAKSVDHAEESIGQNESKAPKKKK